jgi:hypothetical protein
MRSVAVKVVDAIVALIDMAPNHRPFRTIVSAPIQQLLDAYNASADALRPVVAQIFTVPELAGSPNLRFPGRARFESNVPTIRLAGAGAAGRSSTIPAGAELQLSPTQSVHFDMPLLNISPLASAFHGELLEPGDSRYNEARQIWNASVNKHPALIARCSGVSDVIAAVNFARDNGLLTAMRWRAQRGGQGSLR